MLEVQLAMLGLLVLRSLIALIEVVCIQTLLVFKSYYIPNYIPNYGFSYNPTKNLNYNYEKNYSHTNDNNQIMFYT